MITLDTAHRKHTCYLMALRGFQESAWSERVWLRGKMQLHVIADHTELALWDSTLHNGELLQGSVAEVLAFVDKADEQQLADDADRKQLELMSR